MDKKEVIDKLNALTGGDPEMAHGTADELLIIFLRSNEHYDVVKAWENACDRCGFWYA